MFGNFPHHLTQYLAAKSSRLSAYATHRYSTDIMDDELERESREAARLAEIGAECVEELGER